MLGRQCEAQKRGIQQNETKNKADKLSLLTNWSLMVKLHKLSWQFHILSHLSIQQLPRCVMWWPRTAQSTEMEQKSLKSTWLEYYHLRWMKKQCRAIKSFIHLFGFVFLSSDQFYPCLKLSTDSKWLILGYSVVHPYHTKAIYNSEVTETWTEETYFWQNSDNA